MRSPLLALLCCLLCFLLPAASAAADSLQSVLVGDLPLREGPAASAPVVPPFDVDAGLSVSERVALLRSIASVPLKGWNSYDAYGGSVNESVVRFHIDYIAEHLLPFGYRVVCIDAGWYGLEGGLTMMDQWGRVQVDPVRYPSSVGMQGFKQLSAYAHSRGLLLGIHTMRGAHRQAIELKLPVQGTNYTIDQVHDPDGVCPWWADWFALNMSHPAAQAVYDAEYRLYAEWGLDFIKMDCAFAQNAVLLDVLATASAMERSGREMLLSLSPGKGATPEQVEVVQHSVNMYRITDDVWDEWSHLQDHILPSVLALHAYIGKPAGRLGLPSYPDLDMLPFGWIGEGGSSPPYHWSWFTLDEQVSVVSLWAIWRSPLFYGGTLEKPDAASLALVTHRGILNLTDHSTNNAPVTATAALEVWRADADDWQSSGVSYGTLHNFLNATTANATVSVQQLRQPVQSGSACQVTDVWSGDSLGSLTSLVVSLRPHQSRVFQLSACK